MHLRWTVATYVLKNVEHEIEHDVDSAWSLHTLDVPEFYNSFKEYLAI